MRTAKRSNSARHFCSSYLACIVSRTEFSSWPCRGSNLFLRVRHNLQHVLILGERRFHTLWARGRFLELFSLLTSRLRDGCHTLQILSAAAFAAPPAQKSRRGQRGLDACRLRRHTPFQAVEFARNHREKASVLFFYRRTVFCWGRKRLDFKPARR